jgi:hypothetical protein
VPPFGHTTPLRIGIEPHKLVEASGGLVIDLKKA